MTKHTLAGKRILIGITGGIAAYKAAETVRLLRAVGAEVRVVLSRGATAFITPLTLQALSGQAVATDHLDAAQESAIGHIELARWADALLIAPATAHCLAKLRAGLADDLLSSIALATAAPLLLAPAMNRAMWANAATQDNVAVLRQRGVRFSGPQAGAQACGETGIGRMTEPSALIDDLAALWPSRSLAGLSVLITAGPTREAIDPVRYLSNRSSGKMGYALAAAAQAAGAEVILVSGPTALTPPPVTEFIAVESAADMHAAVMQRLAGRHLFIACAAVADYTPVSSHAGKLKKSADDLTLTLRKTTDILAAVAASQPKPFCVGFAAETHDLADYARDKLQRKGLDMVAANWVSEGRGFERNDNALDVFWPGGGQSLPTAPKTQLAEQLIELIAARYRAKFATTTP